MVRIILIFVYYNLTFTAVDPLFIFSFLQEFVETLNDYLGELSVENLKENFDVVYQVAEFVF